MKAMNRSVWVLVHRTKSCLLGKKETDKDFLKHVQVSFLILVLRSTEKL